MHTIKIASVQMDAAPAPTAVRLQRAATLIQQAGDAGAQLVVLPELFNAGYVYNDSNYERAEPLAGQTAVWMQNQAVQHHIHLAGTLLLLDGNEVYNAMLLFAPDGRRWRYDKIYPWGWERAYFRGGRDAVVADTELGQIGMLICWDIAHPELWRRYAGHVDLMLLSSCPPLVASPVYEFADGKKLSAGEINPLLREVEGAETAVFEQMASEQTAWLGVPAVNTGGCGHVETTLPNAKGSLFSLALTAPHLMRYLPDAEQTVLSCGLFPSARILDANGRLLAAPTQADGESVVVAEVDIEGERPLPQTTQPPARAHLFSYVLSDYLLPALTVPVYRRGLRKQWGAHMAPIERKTKVWTTVWAAVLATGVALLFWEWKRER